MPAAPTVDVGAVLADVVVVVTVAGGVDVSGEVAVVVVSAWLHPAATRASKIRVASGCLRRIGGAYGRSAVTSAS
jgi:hypothetical protein